MSRSEILSARINGREPTHSELLHAAIVNYAHFTVMQVRARSTRGLDLHLLRLTSAHRELFGNDLDADQVHHYLRDAVRDHSDCSLRVSCFEMEAGQPLVLTVVRPPVDADEHPWLLTTVDWVRPLAHVKHAGTFGQIYIGAAAERAGYDDAVLVTPGGRIAETTVGNIGFVAGDTVVWPQAPNLPGITRQLLDLHLRDHGCAVVSHPVTCETLDDYDGAFVTNSTGIRAVAGIDGHRFSGDGSRARWLREQYESIPADVI